MVIGGLQKFSLSDYPGMISAIVFTRGCGFRCPWCHNPELVDPAQYAAPFPPAEVRDFLMSRRGQLQGVVVTGGEPTLHDDLPGFLSDVKAMGLAVKLDTNGTNPRMLESLVTARLVDYIAMDVKAPLDRYADAVRAPAHTPDIRKSVGAVIASGLPHEFRTTLVDSLLSIQDLISIAELVKGCDRYVLQSFRSGKVLDTGFEGAHPPDESFLREAAAALSTTGIVVELR
jgi:pyruvate formate lyase activating enzyme